MVLLIQDRYPVQNHYHGKKSIMSSDSQVLSTQYRNDTEQWNKLYSACNTDKELELIYMWVKQGVIDKQTFIDMVKYSLVDQAPYTW